MATAADGTETDTLDQNIAIPGVDADNTGNRPDDRSQVLTGDKNKANSEQSNQKDGKQERRPKRGRSRTPDEYAVNFYYLKNADSARDLMRTHAPAYTRIMDEKRSSDGNEEPYGDFIQTYNARIHTDGGIGALQVESDLYNLWLAERATNETHCWLEIRKSNMRDVDSNHPPITPIEDIAFYGGSMLSPVTFSKHWDMKSTNKVVFENDKQLLSIQNIVPTGWYEVIEIPYSSVHDTIVVHLEEQSTALFVNVKSNPKIFSRKEVDENRTDEKRNVCFQGVSREEFGKCSSFCIELPGNLHDDAKSKPPLAWRVVSRLKRLGFVVVYADVTITPHNPVRFQSPFDDFDMEYAWMCLVSQGFKVTDHFNEENISLLRRSVHSLTAESLYRFAATTSEKPFIHLAHMISTQVNDNKQAREESEELPPGYSMIRRMVLTPTKHVFFPKEPIVQNRIIRQYEEDYFIRIVFRDEDYERVSAMQPNALDSIIEAMKKFMRGGFQILDRNYEFLGCSNSQLREHGFWFFCPNNGISAQKIRDQSGSISTERCVASYVSRFGLCFSASRNTVDVGVNPGEMKEEEDIKRNGYCFSDGIGKLSPYLASQVSSALQLNVSPSAFQIRYGGCKGVVSQDPNLSEERSILVIRNSMNKFTSKSKNLEILQVTSPGRLHLNRQVITLLSGLGIPDKVFLSLQEEMLFSLADMMVYDKEALKALSGLSIDVKFKKLQKKGIVFIREPFFRSMLITIYKSKIRDLMRRARIQLPFENGRIMMGTLDETRTLEYGQVFVQYSCVPGEQQKDSIVLTGAVLATKNPCFHPGDLRKYEAVDVPALHHMFDCIVFPQEGHRPHPDEMSGSDLDGDMYFVCWDDQLCSVIKNRAPMDFPKNEKKKLNHDVTVDDIIEFLGDYIKNDNLGIIANAHVVHADKDSIFTDACKQLATMHSDAVDFPKTGIPAKMVRDLRVDSYPDFMQKTDKPQYVSKKVLGKLFRQCRTLEQAQTRRKDNQRIIRNVITDKDLILIGWEKYEEDAVIARNIYNDKLRQLLTLYGIENETEAITGIIRRLRPSRGCLKNEKYEVGQVVKAKMSVVRKRTRERFFQEFGGESNIDFENIRKEVLSKASAWYQITYHQSADNPEPFLSFPWVIADVLALLKGDKLQKRTEAVARDVTEEDEQYKDNLFDIGSSIVRRFFFTRGQRQLTLNNLKHVAKLVLNLLAPVKGASFIPIGTSIVGLMKADEVTLDIYMYADSKQRIKPLFDFIQSLLYKENIIILERGPCPKYKVRLGDRMYYVRFSTNVNVLRQSTFLKTFVEENKEIVPAILFLLDWGRRTFVVSPTRSGHIFDEITFAMVVIGYVLTMRDLPRDKVSHPKNIGKDANSVETMHVADVDDIPASKTKIMANIVMQFFKDYRSILAENVEKGQIRFIPDPSHRKGNKNLLTRPLNQNSTTSLLNEMLCGYQQIAEKNSIDFFFGDVEFDEDHLVLNLPLDTWDSLMFAEAYIERQLSQATGADVKIRRTNFRETKGIILEAWGTSEQLWNVNKSLQDLGEKSSKFISTSARDKAFIEGAYTTFFEGSRSKSDLLDFQRYPGEIQEHHKNRGPAHLPCLRGVLRNVDPSLEHVDDNDPDCQEFQRVFLEQVYVVRENYDVTYHGILRLAITFGKVYFVDVDTGQITIEDLQGKLHRKHFIERKDVPLFQRGRGRGRGRRRGGSYTNLRNNFPSSRTKMRSSFIPSNCNPGKVDEFLEEMGFKKDGKEKKYHVSLHTGEADFGKPHTGLCVLDRDFRFMQFRLSDLKWLAGDIIRIKGDASKDILDVRCKLQSTRVLEVESVRQMSDLNSLLGDNFRLLEKYGNDIRVSHDFKDRVTFLREKQVNSYSYGDLSDEQSIWHNMKIKVATVKEHSGYNRITGTFSDTVDRTEVTMIPKLPDLTSSDDELKTYARKTWNLALYLGHRFE